LAVTRPGYRVAIVTDCAFKDCNVDRLEQVEERGLYARDDFYRPLEEGVLNSRIGLLRLWPRGRRRESEMRIFVASIVVLIVLYFWDKDYNNGKLVDGLEGMRRSIAHHVFH